MKRIVSHLLPLAALGACGGGEAQNNAVVPPPEETGDLNMAIGGDELSPTPEGEALLGNGASNDATGDFAAPPPSAAPDVANNMVSTAR